MQRHIPIEMERHERGLSLVERYVLVLVIAGCIFGIGGALALVLCNAGYCTPFGGFLK